jgi:hypothetical protein
MIRANRRARFTAADFDFIVRTLARSQTDQVSLVDLLSDVEARDSILDHPRLVDAILNNCRHLRISSQFYFYVLARHVLQQGGIGDRELCDYVASLLETFSRAKQLRAPQTRGSCAESATADSSYGEQYISDNNGQPTIVGNLAHSSVSAPHRRWRIFVHHQRNRQTYAEQVNE